MHLAAGLLVGASLVSGVLLPPAADSSIPGITAVLLNWARLANVVRIVDNLCSPRVQDIVRSVVVWNNNPGLHLTRHHFARSACSRDRLEILNSPFNAYFQARFLACSSATTEFCFLQDDDYLVRTDVIRSLYTHLISSPNLTTVHLLPPHEHLSTALRTTFSQNRAIHTGFAWLGHGALLRRSASSAFLNLLGELRVSDWEMKMADNYYTILSNQYPAVWMDDGIPLDGTGAFTVGTVGDERNWDHITRALRYFERRLSSRRPPDASFMRKGVSIAQPPFDSSTAVCLGAQCTLTTNINRLPDIPSSEFPFNMRAHERARRTLLSEDAATWLMRHPLSHAVDLSSATAFRSRLSAMAGDYVALDLLAPVKVPSVVRFLVDDATRGILRATLVELSQDGARWVPMRGALSCGDHGECVLRVTDTDWRLVRLRLLHGLQEHWTIFDIRPTELQAQHDG